MMQSFDNDVIGSAGWMFADLFIGLMTVFLATVTFVAQTDNSQNPDPGSNFAYTQNYSERFIGSYTADTMQSLPDDITNFIAEARLPQDVFVSNFQLISGYSGTSETTDAAVQRAIKVLNEIKRVTPSLLEKASVQMKNSTSIAPNQFVVTANFAATVDQTVP